MQYSQSDYDDPTKVIIWLGTYLRPQMLGQTLDSLSKIVIPKNVTVELLILDNDIKKSAKKIVDEKTPKLQFRSTYKVNPKRGTVNQRNTFIKETLALDATHICMIDDDETVVPEWLKTMLKTMEEYDADVVDGAVERVLPEKAPNWLIKGKFFDWPNFKTGSKRRAASGANCLFKRKLIDEWGLCFNPAFNLTGGSDTFFFTEASKKGGKIVWLNERLVKEYFPESRATKKWVKQRAFRRTSSKFNRKKLEMGYPRAASTYFFNGVLQLFGGGFLYILSLPFGPIIRLHTLRIFIKGLGTFNGIFGGEYEEYKNIHGQ